MVLAPLMPRAAPRVAVPHFLRKWTRDDVTPSAITPLVVCGFFMTIVWLDILATEVVALIEAAGLLLGISTSILGTTPRPPHPRLPPLDRARPHASLLFLCVITCTRCHATMPARVHCAPPCLPRLTVCRHACPGAPYAAMPARAHRTPPRVAGLTVIAIGNSAGDLVANLAAAKGASAKMALASCFGSPILMTFIGAGGPLTLRMLKTGGAPVASLISQNCRIAYLFLYIAIGSHLVVFPFNGYTASRRYAIFLFALYAVFLLFALLAEGGMLGGFMCPPETCPAHWRDVVSH